MTVHKMRNSWCVVWLAGVAQLSCQVGGGHWAMTSGGTEVQECHVSAGRLGFPRPLCHGKSGALRLCVMITGTFLAAPSPTLDSELGHL